VNLGRLLASWVLAATLGLAACSSDDSTDGGGNSDAGGDRDGSAPADGAPADAARPADAAVPADAALPDAQPSPDAAVADCGRIKCDCTFNGMPLFGQVQYVTDFPDFQVSESAFPDLRVREGSFADSCGEWEIVTSFPDFTVEIVTSFEDFSIEYSDFPGIP
jgi:hypothetical protein